VSSTNRGGERSIADFYPTPSYVVRAELEARSLPGGRWVELGAGDGDIIRAVNAVRRDIEWTALELRDECRPRLEALGARTIIGALEERAADLRRMPHFDVAMFNPPFPAAVAFVLLALAIADWVVCLERTQWVGDSEERQKLFSPMMPDDDRVGRVKFIKPKPGEKKSGDSTPYSWFVWGPPASRSRTVGQYRLLRRFPKEERVLGHLAPASELEKYLLPPKQPQLSLIEGAP